MAAASDREGDEVKKAFPDTTHGRAASFFYLGLREQGVTGDTGEVLDLSWEMQHPQTQLSRPGPSLSRPICGRPGTRSCGRFCTRLLQLREIAK